MKHIYFVFLIILVNLNLKAQDPYRLSWKTDIPILACASLSFGGQWFLDQRLIPLTMEEVVMLKKDDINILDRSAVNNYSDKANQRSRVALYSSLIAGEGVVFYSSSRSEGGLIKNLGILSFLLIETNLVNYGITNTVKNLGIRPRPYVYNKNLGYNESGKGLLDARKSFFSGRTSATAANSFFMAKVYTDYFPESKWKYVVWTIAAVLPAWAGIERVRSGQHFPTDILSGYVTGAICGYFIPHMHLAKKDKIDVQISPQVSVEAFSMNIILTL